MDRKTEGQTDTDRRTNGRTEGHTDGRTDTLKQAVERRLPLTIWQKMTSLSGRQ